MNTVLIAAATAAFNLSCHGVTEHFDGQKESSKMEFRIDLQNGLFCMEQCPNTLTISHVSRNEIVLQDINDRNREVRIFRRVMRETGEVFSTVNFNGRIITFEGVCEAKPFTGFPAQKF